MCHRPFSVLSFFFSGLLIFFKFNILQLPLIWLPALFSPAPICCSHLVSVNYHTCSLFCHYLHLRTVAFCCSLPDFCFRLICLLYFYASCVAQLLNFWSKSSVIIYLMFTDALISRLWECRCKSSSDSWINRGVFLPLQVNPGADETVWIQMENPQKKMNNMSINDCTWMEWNFWRNSPSDNFQPTPICWYIFYRHVTTRHKRK